MNSFKVLGANHTGLTVSDLDRAIAFFCDVLGLELISKAPRDPEAISQITGVPGADIMVAYIQGFGHRIELIEYLAPEDRNTVDARPCDVGHAHLAFNVDNMEAALSAAESHLVRPIGRPMTIDQGPNSGAKVAYLRDPDGITIEFIQPPKPKK